jgi:anti-sigma factor ChrR (cupin superfamily)
MTSSADWTIGRSATSGIVAPVVQSMYYASADKDWQPTETEGFWIKPLFEDVERGEKTMLMKVDSGAWSPMHTHPGELEQIYVVQGSFYDQDRTLGPGDFCCRAPDTAHEAGSKEGAIVLLVYTRR